MCVKKIKLVIQVQRKIQKTMIITVNLALSKRRKIGGCNEGKRKFGKT